jgi:hypothetical protein
MLKFLLSLLPDFLKVYLGFKADTAESLGKAEETTSELQSNIVVLNKEAEAAANSPISMEALIAEQKAGDV